MIIATGPQSNHLWQLATQLRAVASINCAELLSVGPGYTEAESGGRTIVNDISQHNNLDGSWQQAQSLYRSRRRYRQSQTAARTAASIHPGTDGPALAPCSVQESAHHPQQDTALQIHMHLAATDSLQGLATDLQGCGSAPHQSSRHHWAQLHHRASAQWHHIGYSSTTSHADIRARAARVSYPGHISWQSVRASYPGHSSEQRVGSSYPGQVSWQSDRASPRAGWHLIPGCNLHTFATLAAITPEDSQQLQVSLSSSTTVEQLHNVVEQNLHQLDAKSLMLALDVLVKSVATARGTTHFNHTVRQLGQAFMELLPGLSVQDLVQLLHSFAMLRHNPGGDEQGLQAICEHIRQVAFPELLRTQRHPEVTKILWSLATISHHGELAVDTELFSAAAPLVKAHVFSMPLSQLSKVSTAYAEAGDDRFDVLEFFGTALSSRLDVKHYGQVNPFDPGAVTNILKAIVTSQVPPPGSLMQQIATYVNSRSPGLKLHHVVTIAKCFAKLKYGDFDEDITSTHNPNAFWESVSSVVLRHRHMLTAQHLQDILYAFTLRRIEDQELFTVASARAQELLEQGSIRPVNLSILLWAFGRQRRSDDVFYGAACKHILQHYTSFTIQNLSNSLWGLACVNHKDEELMTTIASHLKQLLQDKYGRSQLELDEDGTERYIIPGKCDMVKQYSKDGKIWQDIWYKSGNRVTREISQGVPQLQFNSQNLTDLAWAYAHLGVYDPELFRLLALRSVDTMDSFSLTSVVDLSWSLCKVEHKGPEVQEVLSALDRYLVESGQVQSMGPDYLAEVLFTMARMGYKPTQTFLKRSMDQAQARWYHANLADDTMVRLVYAFYTLDALERLPTHPLIGYIQDFLITAQVPSQGTPPAAEQYSQDETRLQHEG